MRNFYKVLGIASTADERRVKSAFRRRAKALHPDLNPGDRRAEERFKELTQAYEVLRSARARAAYDAVLAARRRDARRRLAGSAAVMVASFVLTMGSAFAVLAINDSGSPLRQGWRLVQSARHVADAATSAVALPVGGDADGRARVASIARVPGTDRPKASPPVPTPGEAARPRQPTTREGKTAEPRARTAAVRRAPEKKLAAVNPGRATPMRRDPAFQPAAESAEGSSPWPTADEPIMGLGATTR